MSPTKLIAMHLDLVERVRSDGFVFWMWNSVNEIAGFRLMLPLTRRAVNQAALYRVSDDMSTLIQFAASQLDASDRWDNDLAPTPAGLVRFDKPVLLTNLQGETNKVHWILWGPVGPTSKLVFMFNDHNDPDELSVQYLAMPNTPAMLGDWGAVAATPHVSTGEMVGEMEEPPPPSVVADRLGRGEASFPSTNATRYLHALWLLLSQTVTETSSDHVPSSSRRAAARKGIGTGVTVVQLRRSESSRRRGESTVEWTHRWMVRGHWRWQAHGEGRQERRRMWIDGYVKGPEDTPLRTPKKIYNIKR